MKLTSLKLLLATALLFLAPGVQAGSCAPESVISSGFTASYLWTNLGTNVTSTSMTAGCNKSGGNTVSYTVAAGNGNNYSGTNRAASGGSFINYFVSTSSVCGNTWNSANQIAFSFTGSSPQLAAYYGCILQGQMVPAGTYTDTVMMTTSGGATGPFPVSIAVQPLCTFSTTPGPVNFSYTSFGGAAVASTTFGVICNPSLPYTMALDATSGVVSGLNYSLLLNTSGSGGTNTFGSNGTGLPQSFYINGTMPAGQAGTCTTGTCSGTDPRTLTITY